MSLPRFYTQQEYDLATRAGVCIENCQEIYEKYGQGASTAKSIAPIDSGFYISVFFIVIILELLSLYVLFGD